MFHLSLDYTLLLAPAFFYFYQRKFIMPKTKSAKFDLNAERQKINLKHINFYDKTLEILEFMLDEYSRELVRADIEFLDVPKNTISTLDFLISSITKVQKGQRLALGLDDISPENSEPQINIIEGVDKSKI